MGSRGSDYRRRENVVDLFKAVDKAYDEAFEQQNADLIEAIQNLEIEIKTDVLEAGATVRGGSMMAVWNSGKTTWDGKILKGLEVVYPEIGKAKKIGNPTVSFRTIVVD